MCLAAQVLSNSIFISLTQNEHGLPDEDAQVFLILLCVIYVYLISFYKRIMVDEDATSRLAWAFMLSASLGYFVGLLHVA